MKVRRVLPCLLCICAVVCGCREDAPHADSVMCSVNPYGWLEPRELSFDNTDSLAEVDMMLAVRLNAEAGIDRLPLVIEFTAPDSTRFVENRTFPVAIPGKRSAASPVVTIPYRRAVRFGQCGRYRVVIKPSETLHGIEAVGLTFQKTE